MHKHFEIRYVPKKDVTARRMYREMLCTSLYAPGVDPKEDIDLAEAVFAAYAGIDIGFVLVSRFASPDGKQVGEKHRWIENTVVDKDWRRGGVADALEFAAREYLRRKFLTRGRKIIVLRATIDNKRPHQLERNGWVKERTTFDSAVQKPATVFTLPRHVV